MAEWRSKVLQNAPLGAFCNTYDLHLAMIGIETQIFDVIFEWSLKTGFTVPLKFGYLMKSLQKM